MSDKTKKKKKGAVPAGAFEALRGLRDELARKEAAKKEAKPPAAKPRPTEAPPAKRADDATLLRRAYSGVAPIDRLKGPRPRHRPEPAAALPASDHSPKHSEQAVHERLRLLTLGESRFEVSDEGNRVEGRRSDVPLEMLRRLRRGNYPVDARLDLHGMVAQEARARVEAFLRAMRGQHERTVLVIHGKGEHSPMGMGVLRGEIAAWLSQGASSEHVAAFATARESDGGAGAVYVLLRR